MDQRMAIYMQDVVDIQEELKLARYMEERGFSEIWQGDNRLARDCIVLMSAFLTCTKKLRVGSGVLPIWTPYPLKTSIDRKRGRKDGKTTTLEPKNGFQKR